MTAQKQCWCYWPLAMAIVAGAVLSELLPIVFGRGANATWNWGFLYVTLRFILLPVACVLHVAWNIFGTLAELGRGYKPTARRASALVSVAYLVALYVDPLPPLRFLWRQ
jgi:hypothetical protein